MRQSLSSNGFSSVPLEETVTCSKASWTAPHHPQHLQTAAQWGGVTPSIAKGEEIVISALPPVPLLAAGAVRSSGAAHPQMVATRTA
eukprot:CAMPEP_0115070908 /NCGR_PEP_ID=MMETSP0227-20121206/13381_1 /TAXON_ID=89957 /ORGANISM="Polarella glacialis, Strain CCMP 1383" /LENGTH=86 /DNA_ID=CAMNT_0002457487 /DNA_START=385 /DNA_END=643 /DNA_ORIENTATION=+